MNAQQQAEAIRTIASKSGCTSAEARRALDQANGDVTQAIDIARQWQQSVPDAPTVDLSQVDTWKLIAELVRRGVLKVEMT